ncbi:hypothetical protein L204_104738 [Cryptococcus depauperatus]
MADQEPTQQQLARRANPQLDEKRDAALGPLRSHRVPLPNELAELTPEEQPGGGRKKDDNTLSINIALDLLVEVHLTARVKGDITIGLIKDNVIMNCKVLHLPMVLYFAETETEFSCLGVQQFL